MLQPTPDANADKRAYWASVKDSTRAVELESYLDRFPNGLFAPLARSRLVAAMSRNLLSA